MNARHLSALLLATSLSFAACGGKGGTPDMPPVEVFPAKGEPSKTKVTAAGEGGIVMRMTAAKDTNDKHKATMALDVDVSGGGQSMDIGMDITMDETSSISDVKPDGSFTMKSTIDDASVKLRGKMAEMAGGMSDPGAMMKGMSTAVEVDARGRMLGILAEGDNPLSGMGMGLDKSFQSGFVPFPEEPVGKGGSWEAYGTAEMMGLTLHLVGVYKVLDIRGKVVDLELTLKAAAVPGRGEFPGAPVEVDIAKLGLEGGGTMTVDLERPTRGAMDLKIDASAEMKAEGETIDMKLKMVLGAKPI